MDFNQAELLPVDSMEDRKDCLEHENRSQQQSVACNYRNALKGGGRRREETKAPVHKLPLHLSEHQRYLANCNTMHFAIEQFSAQAPFFVVENWRSATQLKHSTSVSSNTFNLNGLIYK